MLCLKFVRVEMSSKYKIENCSDEETPHQRWEALCLSV